jgi:uncharacterized membrane protein
MGLAEFISIIFIAISLSACAGIRAFIPPLAISILALAGKIQLAQGFEWMASWEVVTIFGVAALLELAADKVPGVDNLLDAAGLVIKPVAGALLTTSLITSIDPMLGLALGIIFGGGIAGTVHLAKTKLRLASTAFTGGLANTGVSFVEDAVVIGGTVLGIIVPLLIGALAIIGVVFLLRLVFHRRRQSEAQV